MYCRSYPLLYQAYKVIRTLSVTPVGYERTFSKLRYVKNRFYFKVPGSVEFANPPLLMTNVIDTVTVQNLLAPQYISRQLPLLAGLSKKL